MLEKRIVTELADDFLKNSENYLVGVEISPDNVVVVTIDNDLGVAIDDCIALSKYLESKLDREKEDFELEVGSAGITAPFKVLRQYLKNIGKEVEVLTRDGRKLSGVLKSADEAGFTLTVEKLVKPEGAKRKIKIEENLNFHYDEIKKTNYLIRFK
ncbi:MAG: ribosome assembly cofactor RimP [Dysgonamonadaceae bacterium]|jgi:ribosome maturation factor RimP|nr:ribosome assembly cofactor RimP [Dysgonamonadaceae bacterium]